MAEGRKGNCGLEGIADIVSLRHETNLRLERNDTEEGVDP